MAADITLRCAPSLEDARFPVKTEIELFRIAQEALNNALRHGHPKRIDIDLSYEDGRIVLAVVDDGDGFDVSDGAHGGIGLRIMQERVKQDPVYVKMFKEAGMGEPSNGGIRKLIPEYIKTLTSRGAPFDTGKMSDSAKSGFELFKGKAGCANCHNGSLCSDGKPHNLGVPENPAIWSDPLRHVTFVTYAMFLGVENYMNIRRDPGANARTQKSDGSDFGKFMTPAKAGRYDAHWYHLLADSDEELHEFAAKLGLKRRWVQCPPKVMCPHYDIVESKRRQALRLGAETGLAVEVDSVRHEGELMKDGAERATDPSTSPSTGSGHSSGNGRD